jgi:pimeloyl-ACP methyl ester carboxylesterase
MSWGKRIAVAASVLVVALLTVVLTMRAGWWATERAEARAISATPPSQFVQIDGVDLHVRVEGTGPAVVLLHGSIVNLHEWDPVVERLQSRFTTVRLDWPPYGVSGLDPRGVYTTARAAELLAGLVDHLQLENFGLVATSNGVNVALEYYAQHPAKVRALALSVLPLERPSQTRKVDWRIRALAWLHNNFAPDYRSRYWFRMVLKDTTPPGFVPNEEFIETIHAGNNLPGAAQRQREYIASNTRLFKTMDMGAVAGKVTVPVLIQWCVQDTVISQSAEKSVARFTQAPVTLINYPQFGHFPMLEDPDLFARDLASFLDKVSSP